MLGAPPAVVEAIRSVFAPASRCTLTVTLAQVSQLAVAGNECAAATTVPLTAMSAGRSALVPLAYRMVSWYVPAVAASTVTCEPEPTAFVVLQNPVPENPVWLLSTVPSQVPL